MDMLITSLVRDIAPRDYQASIAEIGPDAGPRTWAAALEDAPELLRQVHDRDAFHAVFREFGAWDDDDLAAHTEADDMALMLQFIAGDLRDVEHIDAEPFTDEWWTEFERECERGNASGRLGRGVEPGTVYYYIGS